MSRSLAWCCIVLLLLLLLPSCNSPAGNNNGASNFQNVSGQVITRIPLMTSTPSLTPSPITEKGKGIISHFNATSIVDFNQGVTDSSVRGTIPFTIIHNAKKGVWEVKGSSFGAGVTEYNTIKPTKVSCSATWNVELTLSGLVVPYDTLIANKAGCWMQLSIVEEWNQIEASCSTHLGSASGLVDQVVGISYGPMKFPLNIGETITDKQSGAGWYQTSIWRIESLDVPLVTGCIEGGSIPSGQ